MKKLLLALAVAFGLALPAQAQVYKGTCTSSSTSSGLSFSISGADYDEVTFRLSGTWVATVSWYTSSDGGSNWDAAYPQLVASSAYTTAATAAANGYYIMRLPANATHAKANCTAYTSGTVVITTSAPRSTGRHGKVAATLFDSTFATTATPTTGVLNTSGWDRISVFVAGGTTSTAAIYAVDDSAVSSTITLCCNSTAYGFSTGLYAAMGDMAFSASTSTGTGVKTFSVPGVPKRTNVNGIAGSSTRIRVEGSRSH